MHMCPVEENSDNTQPAGHSSQARGKGPSGDLSSAAVLQHLCLLSVMLLLQ